MTDIRIDGLDDAVVERLRARATLNGRSLEEEVRRTIEAAVPSSPATMSKEEFLHLLDQHQKRLAGRTFSDSTELLREDRER
ncbi:MAG: FitA-like ribbon-helix-helix domain-containing protein [Lacipirellulaceae bacterium]